MPKYQKAFEAIFFLSFLALYYAVSVERNPVHITPVEVLLYIWIAGFAYDEFGEFKDAGSLFYAADFWSLWDLGIIGVGAAYLISRQSTQSVLQLLFYDQTESRPHRRIGLCGMVRLLTCALQGSLGSSRIATILSTYPLISYHWKPSS